MKALTASLTALCVTPMAAGATPVLSTARLVGSLTIYADHAKPNLYYYAPGKLQMKIGADGAPDVTFLILRYTGNAASGNSGTINFHSYLSFHVGWEDQSAKIKTALGQLQVRNKTAQLLPLPIRKSLSSVIAMALEGGLLRTISGGSFVEEGKPEEAGNFTEKSVLLCPDSLSSEAFWDIMQAGRSPIALNCELKAEVFEQPPSKSGLHGEVSKPVLITVATDSVSIALDPKKHPSRFIRGDLGESAPKDYPVMQILCFDFANNNRPNLFSKSIEIEATGVTGKILRRVVRFRASNPAASVAIFRFDAAVSLKKPYRYRILTVDEKGNSVEGKWQTGKPWPVALDITTQPDEKNISTSWKEEL